MFEVHSQKIDKCREFYDLQSVNVSQLHTVRMQVILIINLLIEPRLQVAEFVVQLG